MASEKTKPINEIIQAGMIPLIVPFVSLEKDELMQLEATWILTNVASGSSTQTFFILDCTPNLVNLLRSLNQEIVLQVEKKQFFFPFADFLSLKRQFGLLATSLVMDL